MENIKITDRMRQAAQEESNILGELKNSILKGKGNEAGILGEIVVSLLKSFTRVNTYDYDIIGEDGSRWDVKTKQRTVPVQPHFYATVADFNTSQKCDGYIFVSIYGDIAQIIGWVWKEQFYKKATFYKKGDIDPTSHDGWKFRADCFNLPYSELNLV
jgi:hypothetical protein